MSQVNRQPAQYSRESVVAILELRGDRVTMDRQSDDKRGLALRSSLLIPPLLFMQPALPILDCRPRSSMTARGCKTFMGKDLNGYRAGLFPTAIYSMHGPQTREEHSFSPLMYVLFL